MPATIGENLTFPKVSIHIPAYYEPVDMLKQTLDSVARLGFYNFNVDIYIDTDRIPGSGSSEMLPGRRATNPPRAARLCRPWRP